MLIADDHDDFATPRRELVDGGWMERESGIYWLRPDAPRGERHNPATPAGRVFPTAIG